MPVSLERWHAKKKIFFLVGSSCCCIRYASFLLNGLFIARTSLLKLISLIFERMLILYLKLYCTGSVFSFTVISLTSVSNHVWNNSPYSTCTHRYLRNSIISKILPYLHLILFQHGDVENNPGPDKTKLKTFSCCHWNVNSLVAHNFSKHHQLEAYNSLYNYDFICISETCLDFSWFAYVSVI